MKIRIIGLLFIVASIFIAGCEQNEENKTEERTEENVGSEISLTKEALGKIDLTISTAQSVPLSGILTVPAKLMVNQNNEAQVASLVQGRVHKVFANIGDYVKSGSPLMQIEGLEVGEIKAQFLKAKAQLNFAKTNFNRQKSLFEQNIGSQKALNEAQAEYEKALAEFNAEDKKIHSIGLSDKDLEEEKTNDGDHDAGTLTIKSPISGIIIERNVVTGQLVDETVNSFRIINNENLWVEGQIYENDYPKISGNPEISFVTPAFPNEQFKGKVFFIGQVVDEHTRTIPVRAELLNKKSKLKPQMFGEMKISLSSDVKGILVPSESIVKEGSESYIFIAKNDSTFDKRNIQLGMQINDMIEVIKGIAEGEKIVTKGSFFLKSEMMKESLAEEE